MASEIRFHLDECVSTAIAEGLRRRGIDVTTTPELGLVLIHGVLTAEEMEGNLGFL